MTTTIRILVVVAIAQLLLVGFTLMGDSKLSSQTIKNTLLDFKKSEIDQIVIKGKEDDQRVQLVKKEGKWQTADAFPAEQNKIDSLLTKLEGLKSGLPMATSTSALERFKVADDEFERHIQLKKGDDTQTELYLGSGAGARQTYIRSGKQNAVYTATIGSYEASSSIEDWQDKTVLQVDKSSITHIEFGDMKLVRDTSADEADDKQALAMWQADKLEDGKMLNQKTINESMDALSSLRFNKVLGKDTKTEYGLEKPELELGLKHKDGKRSYQFGKLKNSEDYVLKLSDRDEYFQIASFNGKSLLEKIGKEKWLMDKPEEKTESDSSQQKDPEVSAENPLKTFMQTVD